MTVLAVVSNNSYIKLPAAEVIRLADLSLIEIEQARERAVRIALDQAKTAICRHFFGLYNHQAYKNKKEALENCPRVFAAQNLGHGDKLTCELLKKAAQHPGIDYVYVSLFDYRALA